MPVDTWFPLAIYYEDLYQARKHNARMASAIKELRTNAPKRSSKDKAWTGDVHGVESIHLDPVFSWITKKVEHHAWKYIHLLGYDTDKIDLYFQRSWPVLTCKGQHVPKHAHFTAHISAIYYVSSPFDGDPGCVSFQNTARQNDLIQGIAQPLSEAFLTHNELNSQDARYEPREGRLLIFPSKQMHWVEENQSGEDRISLAFDMVMATHLEGEQGQYQLLPPPPRQWRRFKRE